MQQENFSKRHPIAHKMLVAAGFTATVAAGAMVIPHLADKFSSRMIKNSASAEIPDEGPVIVKNDGSQQR